MTESLKVITTYPFTRADIDLLQEAAQSNVVCLTNNEDLQTYLGNAEVLCAGVHEVPARWRELAPRLRWLQATGAGVDQLRTKNIVNAESGIVVTTAVGMHANTIGEYAFGSMLMFNRRWPEMVRMQDQRVWPRSAQWYRLGGRELSEQVLGIVGLGGIGSRIAHLAKAFGMRVLATKRVITANASIPNVDQLYPIQHLKEMLAACDYIVLAVPLTSETEKLIGEPELRAMQPHAYLVNIARGRVIDEKALIRALEENWIGGAGLDVTEEEPLPAESPLYKLPNVILTPHIAGVSVHYGRRLAEIFADNLRRYRAGEPLRNQYDVERGY